MSNRKISQFGDSVDFRSTDTVPVVRAGENYRATGSYLEAFQTAAYHTRMRSLGFHDVTDPEYGAVGDYAADDTAAIQAAIDAAGTSGGGVVYIPAGTYKLSLATVNTGTSAIHICALKCPYDNVMIVGMGKDISVLKLATGGVYGALQFVETPLENGRTKVFHSGFRGLTIDGNYSGSTGAFSIGQPLIYAVGTGYCEFSNSVVKNSSHYGFGIQNGGHVGLRMFDLDIEETNQDGIDIKNNADSRTATITIATPAVVTAAAHDLQNGDRVRITTTGALPTGLATITDYYVINAGSDTFNLAATYGGSAIATSGTQSGTHTVLGPIDINAGMKLSRINFKHCGKGNDAPNPFANIDADGLGIEITDVTVHAFPTNVDATCEAGIRLKQGQAGDTLGRGTGAQKSMVSNVYITRNAEDATGDVGIAVYAPNTTVTNVHVKGAFDAAFRVRQPGTLTACEADGATIGFDMTNVSGSASAWPYLGGGQDTTLIAPVAVNCGTGIKTVRPNTVVVAPRTENCTIGIDWSMSSATGGYMAARWSGNTDDLQLNGSLVTSAPQSLMFNDGIIHDFMRTLTQGVRLAGDAGGTYVTALSDPTNAKSLIVDATTDESNTTPSDPTKLAILLRVLGATKFKVDYDGNLTTSGGTAIIDAAAGINLPAYTAANIASAAHSVNTANKKAGKQVYDSTNTRVMVATGAGPTDTWAVADASATVTPS